jgi:flavorubredoxin
MMSFLTEDRILFSNDAFGQHYASPERFDDELPSHLIIEEAQKYYGNIVLCYQSMVAKALDSAAGLGAEIIAPSHGLIWRKNVGTILDLYRRWTTNQTNDQALMISRIGCQMRLAAASESPSPSCRYAICKLRVFLPLPSSILHPN